MSMQRRGFFAALMGVVLSPLATLAGRERPAFRGVLAQPPVCKQPYGMEYWLIKPRTLG